MYLVHTGLYRNGLQDSLGQLQRVLGVARTDVSESRGIHDQQTLQVTGLHETPGNMVHAVGPGEVPWQHV